ncbi:MAG TPA: 6-carboxytetrahydropterin synthase [Thermoanaerobaculia bacterium]|nr:6-carboxytetrahydropterin synthase [Thermoanaerobaculia bacterium]
MISLSRAIHFNAAHRLWNPAKSEAWNHATYGDAASPSGYGHNYALEVSVAGAVDAEDGMILNLTDLDRILKEEVDRPLDHRNLNAEIPEFARTVPTAENLARWIWDRVSARLAKEGRRCRLVSLTLRVTPTFAVELADLADSSPAAPRG